MKKKILITGGSGLIGKFLVEKLYKDYDISVLDLRNQINRNKKFFKKYKNVKFYFGSINDFNLLKKTIKKKYCVIHLAAMLGVNNTEKNPNECIRINTDATEKISKLCKLFKVKRVIYASSSEVYGEPVKNPINESFKLDGKSIYAISKILGEKMIKENCKKNNYTIFRFFNTIGETQVAQFVVSKFIKNLKENKDLIINGNGKQVRGYAHAEDIAIGIRNAIGNKKTYNNIYNLGNSNDVCSLKLLAKKIIRLKKNTKSKIKFNKKFILTDRKKDREINYRYCSTKKANKDFNFKCNIGLDISLKRIFNQKKINNFWPKN
jgi:nucleoside-diphosphate-sugar epimerase